MGQRLHLLGDLVILLAEERLEVCRPAVVELHPVVWGEKHHLLLVLPVPHRVLLLLLLRLERIHQPDSISVLWAVVVPSACPVHSVCEWR